MGSRNCILAFFILFASVLAGCGSDSSAQKPAAPKETKTATTPSLTIPFTATAPVIDGKLDEKLWDKAALIDGLTPPLHIKPSPLNPDPRTEVRIMWGKSDLYVFFTCHDKNIISTGKYKHDEDLYREDVCEVFIDPVGDARQYVELQINPAGEVLDKIFLLTAEAESTPSLRLTPKFSSKDLWGFRAWEFDGLRVGTGKLTENGKETGWTVELALPAKTLLHRLGAKEFKAMTMRANFLRYDWRVSEKNGKLELFPANWAPTQHGCPHISPAAMGTIKLVE
ncbi:MAG: carbohydrate-binding family 9-like protein [Planctomycetes bacterium]|nr:carbohydrate-binding family 9-like protein [Planctomycetota bacterium]